MVIPKLVTSHLDYGNYYMGLPWKTTQKLPLVWDAASHSVAHQVCHVTPQLCELYWLWFPSRCQLLHLKPYRQPTASATKCPVDLPHPLPASPQLGSPSWPMHVGGAMEISHRSVVFSPTAGGYVPHYAQIWGLLSLKKDLFGVQKPQCNRRTWLAHERWPWSVSKRRLV